MKISAVRVTPIAIQDPPLLNAAGVHEPWGLRSIIEVEGANGEVGLGETYGDAPVLDLLQRVAPLLKGQSAFDVNALLRIVREQSRAGQSQHVEMELAPGSLGSNLISSVFSAYEVAFMDLQARSLDVPLVELLGGARGIRTLGREMTLRLISSQVHSTTLPSLQLGIKRFYQGRLAPAPPMGCTTTPPDGAAPALPVGLIVMTATTLLSKPPSSISMVADRSARVNTNKLRLPRIAATKLQPCLTN